MTIIDLILIIIILIIILLLIYYYKPIYIKSNIDNNVYMVKNDSNAQYTADTLAILNTRIFKLLTKLKADYNGTNNFSRYLPFKNNVDLLLKRFSTDSLIHNFFPLGTSFTFNKGTFVSMCIDKNNDLNTIIFVLLHELAHIGNENYGHDDNFKKFFKFLIEQSVELDIYTSIDYNQTPVDYCGIKLNKI